MIVLLHGHPLKGVCIKLQKHNADIVTAYRHIDLAIEEVSYMREDFDSVWSEWFGEAESLTTDIGAVITIPSINSIVQMFQLIHQVNIIRDV